MNIEKKVQSLQANSGLYTVSRASQDRPVIVGWPTAPRGLVDCTSWSGHRGEVRATPEETAAARRVLARTEASRTNPGGTGWTTPRSLGEVGTNSVPPTRYAFVVVALFSDFFLSRRHRKKSTDAGFLHRGHMLAASASSKDCAANFAFVGPQPEYAPVPFRRHRACTIC